MTAYTDALARDAIDEAISHGCTLEGLQDALTRRMTALRMSPVQAALDRSFNPNTVRCDACGVVWDEFHVCTSEV